MGQEKSKIDIEIKGEVSGVGTITGDNATINIYNSKGKKLITKEEIEAQRAKEEKIIFSNVKKSKNYQCQNQY